jgi:hypothetical protein
MIFEIETVRNSPIVKEDSRLVAYGHGAYGEPDNTYQDYKYVWLNRELVEVHDRQYLVFDENRVLLEVVNDYDLPETVKEALNPELVEQKKNKRKELYEKLKSEFE